MNWEGIFTIVGVNVALIGVFTTIVVWMVNKIDADIKSTCNRLDGHATRIDQLYRMFVDLLQREKK
jgi:hypothetical protein